MGSPYAHVLTPQRPQGAITPLTPLTSELAKVEYNIEAAFIFRGFSIQKVYALVTTIYKWLDAAKK